MFDKTAVCVELRAMGSSSSGMQLERTGGNSLVGVLFSGPVEVAVGVLREALASWHTAGMPFRAVLEN